MYHSVITIIQPANPLYPYLDNISRKANNLYNASLFRQRQVMTATRKMAEGKPITDNEKEVMEEIANTLPSMNPKFEMPTAGKWALSYHFMDDLLKRSNNPDYCCKELPKQCAQQILKNSCRDMKAFRKASASFKKNPAAFTGAPKLPRYHKPGGCCTFYFTNQQCVRHGECIRFPFTDLTMKLSGSIGEDWIIKQVNVTPYYDAFKIQTLLDDGKDIPEKHVSKPERVCAIDLGVNNFAAVTNNIGLPCLLFKGGAAKSINHLYNKEYAEIQSRQTSGTKKKFVSTPELQRLCKKRDAVLSDYMHKIARRIIDWCVANHIDTIVVGEIKGWKQSVTLGKPNNQNFVQLPYTKFKEILAYLCEREGITYLAQEEAYTSKASFPDQDNIPLFRGHDASLKFSGKRSPTVYKGQHRPKGFRGIYVTKDGTAINADLNGSANIGRKAFPELFPVGSVCFDNPIIYKHPDCIRQFGSAS